MVDWRVRFGLQVSRARDTPLPRGSMSSCLRFQADEASMIVLALEPRLVLACVAVTAAFEFLRILIGAH